MQGLDGLNKVPRHSYLPEKSLCLICRAPVKRSHILWRKELILLTGPVEAISWAYRCPDPACAGAEKVHFSAEAETLHLKHRRFGRDVVVHVGYRRFWYHQTMYEIHEWLTRDLGLTVSDRHVLNLIADFLALLRAAQPAKVRAQLKLLK